MPLFIPVRKWLHCTMGVFVSMLGKLTSPTFELLLMGFMKMYIPLSGRQSPPTQMSHNPQVITWVVRKNCTSTQSRPTEAMIRKTPATPLNTSPMICKTEPGSVQYVINVAVYWGELLKKIRVFICITYGGYFCNLVNKSVSIKISATWRNDILTDFG